MRRALYGFLSALPSKAFSGGLAIAGIIATAWPEEFRKWANNVLTAEQAQLYGVVAIGMVAVYLLLMVVLKPPEENGAILPTASSTSGSHSQAISGQFHGPVTITTSPLPNPLPHSTSSDSGRSPGSVVAAVRRDVGLAEALAYAMTGRWGVSFLDALSEDLSNAAPVSQARQLAFDGIITIWGRRTARGVYEEIPRDYWSSYQPEWFSLMRGEPHTERTSLGVDETRFTDLMASKVEFEREWPARGQTASRELPDISVRELLERVANERGIHDDGSLEALRQYRDVARDMSDQFSLHAVAMWGRIDGRPLSRIDDDVSKLGFGVGRYADGKIHCTKTYRNGDDVQVWIDHLHVRKEQVDRFWPTGAAKPRLAEVLIAAGRDWAHEFTESANGDSFGFRSFLEGKRLFADLRPHLTPEYIGKLNAQRMSYATADGAKYPALVSWFLDELDRLEGEWGLR